MDKELEDLIVSARADNTVLRQLQRRRNALKIELEQVETQIADLAVKQTGTKAQLSLLIDNQFDEA